MHPIGTGETIGPDITKFLMRTVGDQAKKAGGSLQLCAGLEDGIEGATHVVAQRRKERSGEALGERANKGSEGSEEKGIAEPSGTARSGEAARVRGIREVPRPPREKSSEEEGKRGADGANGNIRTAMAGMDVGGEYMDEGEGVKVKQDNIEA